MWFQVGGHFAPSTVISAGHASRCSGEVPELKGTWRAEDGSRGTFQGLKAGALPQASASEAQLWDFELCFQRLHRFKDRVYTFDVLGRPGSRKSCLDN